MNFFTWNFFVNFFFLWKIPTNNSLQAISQKIYYEFLNFKIINYPQTISGRKNSSKFISCKVLWNIRRKNIIRYEIDVSKRVRASLHLRLHCIAKEWNARKALPSRNKIIVCYKKNKEWRRKRFSSRRFTKKFNSIQ